MKAIAIKLAFAVGMLAFAISCTAKFNLSDQTPQSPKVTAVTDSANVTAIKIDGSSTVYPITNAIAKEFQADSKNNALGYFGYAYYQENQNKLKVVAVNNGKGSITPSRETVEKAKYQPLSRPLFIYVNLWSSQNKGVVYKFTDFYIQKAPKIATSVGYVPLADEAYKIDYVHLYKGKVGTVFGGKSQLDLTLGELLRKQKQF